MLRKNYCGLNNVSSRDQRILLYALNFFSKLFLVCLTLFVVSTVYAQDLPKVIAPNPEVAALGKYSDIPVGYHTGVPNIAVPLVQLSGKSINIPVSLSYHASGIRVNEFASRVGLGWALNAGGAISRSVRGIPDDYVTGFLNAVVDVDSFLVGTTAQKGNWISTYYDEYDFESDIYHYNFSGESGKFFFKQNGEIVTHPKSDIKIVPEYDVNNKIIAWVVTALDGTQYHFGQSKDNLRDARDLSTSYAILENGSAIPDPPQSMEDYTTSWKLMDIETIDKELTSFSYSSSDISFYNLTGQQHEIATFWGKSGSPTAARFSYSSDKVHRITSISNDRGSISFEYNEARTDLKFDFALTDVILKDKSNNVVDAYELNFGYFTSTQHLSSVNFGDLDQRRKRLYLQNVKQTIGNETNKQYTFTYNTSQILPDRYSYAQDFWGYYNGQTNTKFHPEIEWVEGVNQTYTTIPGGDRKVYETFAKACMLTKITYPTGGSTEFTFESNKIGNIGFFGLTETEVNLIDGLTTENSSNNEFEKVIIINNTEDYVGGIFWDVDFESSCAALGISNTSIDCPKAELYKYNGTSYDLISATNGAAINSEGIVFDPTQPLQLRINLYNYSGSVDPATAQDISANVFGRELTAASQNAVTAGGLRVSSIKTFDNDNTQILQRDFLYTEFDDATTTSGAALNPPTFMYENMPFCDENGAAAGPMDLLLSNSIFPLTNGSSYTTCYLNVTELLDGGDEGKVEYTYNFVYDGEGVQTNIYAVGVSQFNINTPLQDFSHRRGLLNNKKTYAKLDNGSYELVQEVQNSYNAFGENLLDQNISIDWRGCFGGFTPYQNLSERFYQTQQLVTDYFDSGDVVQTTTYGYDPVGYSGRTFPLQTSITDSRGNTRKVKTYFPGDKAQLSGLSSTASTAIDDLVNQNRIATPIQVNTILEDSQSAVLSEMMQRNNYKNWGSDLVFMENVETAKGNSPSDLEERVQYHSYYDNGNLKEVSKANGSKIVYLWGYDEEYPVAMIENADYSSIEGLSSFGNNFTLGDGLSQTQENQLRGLQGALVTTYTYDRLIGITSSTDPKGYTTTYHYDAFNRLEAIKDEQGNLVQDYQYHYQGQ